MNNMKLFRHRLTGREDYYPEHIGNLAFSGLEPVEPGDDSPCYDCVVDPSTIEYDGLDAVEEDEEYGD